MKISTLHIAAKILPASLFAKAEPHLERVDGMLSGGGDSAVSRRMALFAFAIRVFSAAIAYFSQIFLARWMGEYDYGIYVSIWVGVVILGGIACLGFQTGVIRFISEYRNSGEDNLLRGSIVGALTWSIVGATVIAGLGVLGIYYFGEHFIENSHFFIPIYLAAICLPMLALQESQDGVARAYNWAGIALTPTFILRPILILLVMIASIYLGYEPSASMAMIATIIAVYLATAIQFVILRMNMKETVPAGPRTYQPSEWLKITFPIFLIEGFYNLLTNVDILILARYVVPDQVGIYFAAAKTLALVHFVYFAVKAASAHRFSTYHSSGNKPRFEEFIRETIHWTFWPSLALALLMLVTGKYLLMLFGENFSSGESVIWILTIGIIVRASVGAAESVLTMSGKQKMCAIVYAATLFVAIALNILLIPIYGLNGAAMATTMALCFEAFALYAAAKRTLGLHIFIVPSSFFNPSQKKHAHE